MTADTRPVAQEAALDRLRQIVKPGSLLYVVERGGSRSGSSRYLSVYSPEMCHDLTADIAVALGFRMRGAALVAPAPFAHGVMLRLTGALFHGAYGVSWRTV